MARTRTTTTPTTARARRVTTTTTTIVPAIASPIAPVPAIEPAIEPAVDTIADRFAATFPDVAVPPFVVAMARAFATVAPMPTTTRDERTAVRDAIVASLVDAIGDRPVVAKTVGRFSNMHVFESQNSMYVAAAMSGAYVTDGHFVAAWAADLPIARCDYMGTGFDKSYPTSTLSDYLGTRHGIVPNMPGARAAVWAWHVAKRNRPAPPTFNPNA